MWTEIRGNMANYGFIPVLLVAFLAAVDAEESHVITTVLESPYVMLKDSSESLQGNDRFEGYLVDLIEEIAEIADFSYKLQLVKDHKYGSIDAAGTWNGMIGEVLNGEANMTLAALTITYMRERVVDFSQPFMSVGLRALVKKAERGESTRISIASMRLLLEPFTTGVWLCLVAAFILVSMLFFVFTRFLPSSKTSNTGEDAQREQNRSGTLPSCLDGFWLTCRSLFFQGFSGDKSPSSIAVRILAVFWFGFVMMSILLFVVSLNNMFPGQRIEKVPKPIQSFEDLATQTEIKYGTLEGGSTKSFFRESRIPFFMKMWVAMEFATPSVFVRSIEDGIDRTLNEPYAFIAESSILDYVAGRHCNLEVIGGLMPAKGYGFAFPLGSPLRERVSLALLKLQENQKMMMLYNKWWHSPMCGKKDHAQKEASSKERPASDFLVDVEAFSGPLVFMVIGVLLALLAAVVEIIAARVKGTKRKGSHDNEEDIKL